MSIFIVKAKKTALQSPLSTTATFITVRELVDSKGNALTMSHFGDWFVIAIKQGDKQEMIKCTNITQNSNGTATVTVATNGRNLDPTSPYVGYATGESFQSGEVIVTNDPLTLSVFAHLDNEQIWTETQTFEKAPIIEADGTEDNEAVRKSQLDNAVFGTPMITPVVFPGVAGETILVDKVVYLDEDGMWYLADAETVGKSENVILGISRGGGTTGNAIGGGVTIFGGHTASSAIFTANTHYYVSDTDGELSDTPGTLEVSLGVAKTTTLILLYPRYNQQLTESIQDALVGNNTDIAVGSENKFVTQTGLQHGAENYAEDAGANDTYEITLSPVPTSYTNGMVVHFKANTANTGACTLNVNELGAKTIKKNVSGDLLDNDILAGQIVTVIYDGTNFQLVNVKYQIVMGSAAATALEYAAITNTTVTHNAGFIPSLIKIKCIRTSPGNNNLPSMSIATIKINPLTGSVISQEVSGICTGINGHIQNATAAAMVMANSGAYLTASISSIGANSFVMTFGATGYGNLTPGGTTTFYYEIYQ